MIILLIFLIGISAFLEQYGVLDGFALWVYPMGIKRHSVVRRVLYTIPFALLNTVVFAGVGWCMIVVFLHRKGKELCIG